MILSIDDADRFDKKIIPIKTTSHDWLINYIPEPIRKSKFGFKDRIVSTFKTNTLIKSCVQEKKETKQIKKN